MARVRQVIAALTFGFAACGAPIPSDDKGPNPLDPGLGTETNTGDETDTVTDTGTDTSTESAGREFLHTGSTEMAAPGCVGILMAVGTNLEGQFAAPADIEVTWTSNQPGQFYADDDCTTPLMDGKSKIPKGENRVQVSYSSATGSGSHELTATAADKNIKPGVAKIKQVNLCAGVEEPVTTKSNFTSSAGLKPEILAYLNDATTTVDGRWRKVQKDGVDLGFGISLSVTPSPVAHANEFSLDVQWVPEHEAAIVPDRLYFGPNAKDFDVDADGTFLAPFWPFPDLQSLKFDKVPSDADPTFSAAVGVVLEQKGPKGTPDEFSPKYCLKGYIKGSLTNTQATAD